MGGGAGSFPGLAGGGSRDFSLGGGPTAGAGLPSDQCDHALPDVPKVPAGCGAQFFPANLPLAGVVVGSKSGDDVPADNGRMESAAGADVWGKEAGVHGD